MESFLQVWSEMGEGSDAFFRPKLNAIHLKRIAFVVKSTSVAPNFTVSNTTSNQHQQPTNTSNQQSITNNKNQQQQEQ